MQPITHSIAAEFQRYRALSEAAFQQLDDDQLGLAPLAGASSIATIAWHIAGNLRSRFTDFLTSDGEKAWRDREVEFAQRQPSREQLLAQWGPGWAALEEALGGLGDSDLGRTVTIRSQPLSVHAALHRSLAHTSYHAGQIVYVAKALRGVHWRSLSIPPGGSAAYNQDPGNERGDAHARGLGRGTSARGDD